MKNKFISFIMLTIIFFLTGVFVFFGLIIWDEIKGTQTTTEVKDYIGDISEIGKTMEDEVKVPNVIENPLSNLGNSDNSKNVNYENVVVDKYFYNQLDDNSKTIYKAFETNKENMKTGTYRIELGSSLSNLMGDSSGQEKLNSCYQSAIEAYVYDNPDVFYLDINKMFLNIETTTSGNKKTYNFYIDTGNETSYLSSEFSSKSEIDSACEKLENIKKSILSNKTGKTYDDIKMVHDYIIKNTEYDTTLQKSYIFNIYGALINNEAVCEGYAKSFKYLMDGLGIPCTLVIGQGTNQNGETENHAWNYVEIDNKWYAIDTTWDDPVSTTGYVSESAKHKYFLKGSEDMSKDHVANGQFSDGGKIFSYPSLNSKSY